MAKEKKRIDTSAERRGLASNPFADLRAHVGEPHDTADAGVRPEPEGAVTHGATFSVARTRKGGWPVRTERRAAGKTVTVVERVSGDANALLAALRKRCGAGGAVREGTVEIQGDHCKAIAAYLDETL
ncbi:MAG: translation initiation factor [Candidatus Hydrogenedentales bacterium]